MKYAVAIWTDSGWFSSEVWVWVDASDPAEAVVLVMGQCGLRSALQVLVSTESNEIVAEFSDVGVSVL